MKRLPLRLRVALGYGLTGLALSLAFAGTLAYLSEAYEEIFVTALLDSQAQAYFDRLAIEPATALPRSPGFSIYQPVQAPKALRALAPGEHELDLPGHPEVQVSVYERGDQRLIAVIDMGPIEAIERFLAGAMVAVAVGGTLLSAWLGWVLAGSTIRPVERLADAVDAMSLTPTRTRLATGYPADGVGRLAAAIDAYQGRVADADDRERDFFANASHELLTPIAVIQSTLEVLKEDPRASDWLQTRLDRIERSTAELAMLLDALMLSARAMPADRESIDLQQLCWQAQTALAAQQPEAAQRIVVIGGGPEGLAAHRRLAACIVGVLFHRISAASTQARWQVRLDEHGLEIGQTSDDLQGLHVIHRSDLGIGIVFVERMCHVLGWSLEQRIGPQGLSIRLRTAVPH